MVASSAILRSAIEDCCAIDHVPHLGPDTYKNANPVWHPPGARGIYGGVAIAQCLNAAYATVPSDFAVHSMHCHFHLSGNSDVPVVYTVERVRDGRNFMSRSVRALQGSSCFFQTTVSFQKVSTIPNSTVLMHAIQLPAGVTPPAAAKADSIDANKFEEPFETVICGYAPEPSPETRKQCQWIRAHGIISGCPPTDRGAKGDIPKLQHDMQRNNQQAHICALAYISDSDFLNTVSRVYRLAQYSTDEYVRGICAKFQGSESDRLRMETWLQGRARDEATMNNEADRAEGPRVHERLGMLVSLNHTIFFHNHQHFRADEWLFSEMKTPWAGDERAVVTQHIWTANGTLIATCIQEGVIRISKDQKALL